MAHSLTEEEWAKYQEYQQQQNADKAVQPPAPDTDACLTGFLDMLAYMLNAVAFVFPECSKTRSAQDDLRIACNSKFTKVKIIEAWHNTMHPYYPAVTAREDSALRSANIEWFQKLDIMTKWDDPDFSQESKDNMWTCLENLNKYAGMYHSIHNIPDAMMSNIHATAFEVFNSIQAGGASLEDLDLFELGEKVVANSSAEDLRNFTKSIPQITQNFGGLENIMKIIQGGMPGMEKSIGALPQ